MTATLTTGGSSIEEGDSVSWGPLRLGPFDLDAVVGRGGMGLVWSGRHESSGLPVAVKVLTARQFRHPRARAALANEIRAASVLCHPGIALLFDQGLVDEEAEATSDGRILAGSPYVVMELVSGGTLGESPPQRWTDLRRILMELLGALGHAHARGIVHRDLKPSNVLLAAEGDLRSGVRLTDWGIARALLEEKERDGGFGTVHYMAPEQLLRQWRDQGPWTDLYSLGCLAYRLAGGRRPAAGDSPTGVARAHLEGRLEPFEPWMPLPAGFEDWLDGLLERDPDARFQRAADAAHALQELGEADDDTPLRRPMEPFGLRALTRRETLPGFVTDRSPFLLVDSSATSAFNVPALLSDELPSVEDVAPSGRPPPAPVALDWRPEPGLPPLPLLVGAGLGLVGLRPPPLVGRARLRDRLWRRLVEVARSGKPGLVVLTGDRGCGKTRLAEWVADRAEELGSAAALRVNHHPHGGPGHGVAAALQRALSIQGLEAEEAQARCIAFCRARGGDEAEGLALAELLATPDDAEARGPWLAILRRALRRLASRRPLLLRLDDIQWGPQTLDLVRTLLEGDPMPVLLVATWNEVGEQATADRPQTLAAEFDVATLPVPPLPAHDQETLVDGLLGLEPSLRAAVLERAGGMPLFAVELVSDEVRRDRLVPGPQGWRLRPDADARLPDGLHSLWMERAERALDGLAEDATQLLELASTLGEDIDERELRAVARSAQLGDPQTLIGRLQAHNLATTTPQGLRLNHGLLRESLLRSARDQGRLRAWHAICADTLWELHGDASAAAAERIGRHLRGAGRLEAALKPLLQAAERRRERGDYDRALALLETRERSIQESGAGPERSAEGAVVEARIAGNRAQFERAAELCEAVVQHGEAAGWGQVVAAAMRTLAFAWWQQGRYEEAEALYRDARERFAAHEAALGLGRCELGLGIAAYHRADLDAAEERFEHAQAVFRKAGILRGVVDALGWRGILSRRRGHNGEAQQRFREAMEAAESAGLRFAANAVRNSLAVTYRAMNQPRKAEAVFRRVLSEAELMGTGEAVWPCINLGLLRLADGEPGKAAGFLRRALGLLEDSGRVTFAAGVRVALMACAGAMADWEGWAEHHAAALVAAEVSSVPHPDVAEAAERASRSARAAGRPLEESQALLIALTQWKGLGDEQARARVQERLDAL